MKRLFAMLASAVLVLSLAACSAGKYRVDYGGSKDWYDGAKDYYRAGEKVTLYYDMIATDTNYYFYLDGEPISVGYDDSKGFIIEFTMPEHDVSLSCEWYNSMEYTP